jgi:hypothetical protein
MITWAWSSPSSESSHVLTEIKRSVRTGQSFSIGSYDITYLGLNRVENGHLEDLRARLLVQSGGREIATMEPEGF